jgi:hypothetical protein
VNRRSEEDIMPFPRESGLLSKEALTDDECEFLLEVFRLAGRGFRARHCYENAAELSYFADLLAARFPGMHVQYGEGKATKPGMPPASHAVLVLNGKAVDLTWRQYVAAGDRVRQPAKLLERAKYCLSTCQYDMTRFEVAGVRRRTADRGWYGPLNPQLAVVGAHEAKGFASTRSCT